MELDRLEVGVVARRVGLGLDVELVVDVHVRRIALGEHGGDRLPRQLERDRLVPQPVPLAVGDDGALVADHRIVERRRLDRAPNRLRHPAGDDDHVQARLLRARERGQRALLQLAVHPRQRAVEVARDDADVAREVVGEREAQPFGLPPVVLTT